MELMRSRSRKKLPTALPDLRDESGQGIFEYALLLTVVALVLITTLQWFNQVGFTRRLASPLTESYAKIYKYGHPKAKGPDEGEPEFHPALPMSNNRFFINPH